MNLYHIRATLDYLASAPDRNLQGRMDEIDSATYSITLLSEAERQATRFDRPAITRELNGMILARAHLVLELFGDMDAVIQEAA